MPQQLAACEYKTGKTLGSGSYAVVKEAIKIATGEKFAVKQINKKLMRGKEKMIINEIEILKKISRGHPNTITLWDYFETPNNLYLVMDLCTGGELFDRICAQGQFYEKDAAKIIYTTVDTIKYLHSVNVVHRDIKPENMIFKDNTPDSLLMIGDFGLAKIVDSDASDSLRTTCGTPGYMAPEIIEKTGHGKPVDMWSIGVMTFFLLSGYLPFESENNSIEIKNIVQGIYYFDDPVWDSVSEHDFIKRLIVVDPAKRMTAEMSSKHPFLHPETTGIPSTDLYESVKKGFEPRKMFRKAVTMVKAVQKMSKAASETNLDQLVFGDKIVSLNEVAELN